MEPPPVLRAAWFTHHIAQYPALARLYCARSHFLVVVGIIIVFSSAVSVFLICVFLPFPMVSSPRMLLLLCALRLLPIPLVLTRICFCWLLSQTNIFPNLFIFSR